MSELSTTEWNPEFTGGTGEAVSIWAADPASGRLENRLSPAVEARLTQVVRSIFAALSGGFEGIDKEAHTEFDKLVVGSILESALKFQQFSFAYSQLLLNLDVSGVVSDEGVLQFKQLIGKQ